MLSYYIGGVICGIIAALVTYLIGFAAPYVLISYFLGTISYSIDEVYRKLHDR